MSAQHALNPEQFASAMEPREGRAPAIEEAMEQRAWRNLQAGPDADSGD